MALSKQALCKQALCNRGLTPPARRGVAGAGGLAYSVAPVSTASRAAKTWRTIEAIRVSSVNGEST